MLSFSASLHQGVQSVPIASRLPAIYSQLQLVITLLMITRLMLCRRPPFVMCCVRVDYRCPLIMPLEQRIGLMLDAAKN